MRPLVTSCYQVLNRTHEDLASACESNMYTLEYLIQAGEAMEEEGKRKEAEPSGGEGLEEAAVPVGGSLSRRNGDQQAEKKRKKDLRPKEGAAKKKPVLR